MSDTMRIATFALGLLSLGAAARAQEPRFEVAGHLATTVQQELDATDLGFGGRFGFRPTPLLGLEGELTVYPSDLPENAAATSSRLEGLFGVTVGPRFDRFAVFGKARPGFVKFQGAREPFACILIYPPPLSCELAQGRTVFALDVGGGVEIYPTERSVLRFDASSLLLRYPGPAFTRKREAIADDSFWRGNLRLSFSVGLRF